MRIGQRPDRPAYVDECQSLANDNASILIVQSFASSRDVAKTPSLQALAKKRNRGHFTDMD